MSTASAPVAVVIVSWNSARWLPGCLDSLRRLDPPAEEIVVVDNASDDGGPALVRDRYPEVRLIEAPANEGFCRANNTGIARTRSEFVLVLNPDTELQPDFLARAVPGFEDADVGIVAGKLLRFDRATLDSAGQLLGRSRQPVDRGYGEPDRGQFARTETVFGACGAAALYRRRMLADIDDGDGRYFDEAFFAFGEDLDLAWRAGRRGWRAVYVPAAVGYHARGGSRERRTRWGRFAAMLDRPAAVRFHITKNRYLAILRNDRPRDYLRDLPFIATRDLATVALLAAASPGVLLRLWRERAMFRRALEKRRADARRPPRGA